MARDRQNYALQTIFSFFLGLMVLAFIGIGVNTFYPQPQERYQEQLDELYRSQEPKNRLPYEELTAAERKEFDAVQEEINVIQDKIQEEQKAWARNTSIVLILFATLVMGVSLVRSEQLRVISNGLLLGGLFTMIYGVGWVIFSGESVARFAVVVFAFAISIALGYVKFVRERGGSGAAVAVASTGGTVNLDDATMAALSARLDALEARAAAAAAALAAPFGGAGNDRE